MSDNTVNPSQLFTMSNATDEIQMFDPSLVDVNDLLNFNLPDLDNLDNVDYLGTDDRLIDSVPDGAATAVPGFDEFDFSGQTQEMIPMPQSLNPSPATLAPPPGLPALPAGLAYHPAIGFYYPVPNSQIPGFSGPGAPGTVPPFAAPPAPMFSQAPVAPVAGFGGVMAELVPKTPKEMRPPPPPPPSNKRKFGPSHFFGELEQAKRCAIGDGSAPLPASRDSDPSKPTNGVQQQKRQNAAQAAGAMKDINTATVMRCRCEPANKTTEQHIPRPRNAFIIFRTWFSSQWRTTKGKKRGTANATISVAAGQAWAALEEHERARYRERAAIEKAEHRVRYPNYSYTPIKKIQAKFGQSDCTCGAYETNMAEFKRLKEGGATPPNRFMAPVSETGDDDGAYTAPRTRSVSRANSIHTPTAPVEPSNFQAEMAEYNYPFEPGNEWEDLKAFNNAAEYYGAEQAPATRRSSRNGKKTVHYADDANEDDDEEASTTTATRKHRPSPISTSRKSSNSSQMSAINSDDFKLSDTESVASRTRSKSVSTSGDETALPTGTSSPDSLFDGDSDIGDNIVVATPKASPKRVALALPPSRTARQTRSQSRGRTRRRS